MNMNSMVMFCRSGAYTLSSMIIISIFLAKSNMVNVFLKNFLILIFMENYWFYQSLLNLVNFFANIESS